MEKEITGTIEYTLKITQDELDIEFNESIDNELAVLVMTQYLLESAAAGLGVAKKELKGKEKQIAQDQLRSVLSGRQGLRTLVNIFLNNYDHMKSEESKPKITVENGRLTDEEILKLPNGDKMLEELKKKRELSAVENSIHKGEDGKPYIPNTDGNPKDATKTNL